MADNTELSIVIVSYNVRRFLAECLLSIVENTEGVEYEIIVVDNNSTDESAEEIKRSFPDVRLIANSENVGFAKANNQGYKKSKGKYILLLNPDTIVRKGAIRAVLDFMKTFPDAGIAGCRLLNPDGSLQRSIRDFPSVTKHVAEAFFLDRLTYSFRGKRAHYRAKPFKIDYAAGAFLMVRREALGGMDLLNVEFFMYSEEKDLSLRLRKKGWNTYFVPYAEITHYGGKSTSQIPVAMFLELQKSQVKFFLKHYSGFYALLLSVSWGMVLLSGLAASFPLIPFKKRRGRLRLFAQAVSHYPLIVKDCLKIAPWA